MAARESPGPQSWDIEITVGLSRDLLERLDRWIGSQASLLDRSVALGRLAEIGLNHVGVSSKVGKSSRGAEQAAGMASDMIDSLADRTATDEHREQRKSRLVKGPSEFRDMRKKHDDARRKK